MMLTCRLSEELDQDIIEAIHQLPKRDRSRTLRMALRAFFLSPDTKAKESITKTPQLKLELTQHDLKGSVQDVEEGLDEILSIF